MKELTSKEMRKLLSLYQSLVNYYFANGRTNVDLDDRPYYNLASSLYSIIYKEEFYDDDIMWMTIDKKLEAFSEKLDLNNDHVNDLINSIIRNFEFNKRIHFIILPLNGSVLD